MSESVDMQHGLLSFANPNYNLASPDVNSNHSSELHSDEEEDLISREGVNLLPEESDPYQSLYEELDAVCHFRPSERRTTSVGGLLPHSNTTPGGRMGVTGLDQIITGSSALGLTGGGGVKGKTRRSYAQLDLGSMGVDVDDGGSELLLTGTGATSTGKTGILSPSKLAASTTVGSKEISQPPVSPYQSLIGPDSENNIGSLFMSRKSKNLHLENINRGGLMVDNRTASGVQLRQKKKPADGVEGSRCSGDITLALNKMGRHSNSFLDYYMSLETAVSNRSKQFPDKVEQSIMETEDDPGSTAHGERIKERSENSLSEETPGQDGIPHVPGDVNNDLYAVPVKRRIRKSPEGVPSSPGLTRKGVGSPSSDVSNGSKGENDERENEKDLKIPEEKKGEEVEIEEELLPPGWERHQDDDGSYYWHISSGTIQREPPTTVCPSQKSEQSKRLSHDLDVICNFTNFVSSSTSSSSSSGSSSTAPLVEPHISNHRRHNKEDLQMKRRSYPQAMCSLSSDKKPIRFAVRSLGWVEIAEEDLTPERSSKAVNKCIVDLSLGRNDILDVVGRWGDGKDLYMDLDDYCLRLTNPQDFTVLNTQPIHTIRVWGVGRDNGRERDFAYVARDRMSRKHMCHVFRCDNPARIIANTLRDICKKIMIERSLQQNLAKQVLPGNTQNCSPTGAHRVHGETALGRKEQIEGHFPGGSATRPTDLPTEQRRLQHKSSKNNYESKSFPTPMEEPKKLLKAQYLGSTKVDRPVGMEVLNFAIDRLSATQQKSEHKFVHVAVAPSTITVIEAGEEGKVLAECRVRFLSFLGIGRNVKTCAFIMHTAHEQYVAHVFACEPSSGALCKTIEAACKLRYQKCLDAHRLIQERKEAESQQNKGLTTTIRNVLGNLTTRLSNKGPET